MSTITTKMITIIMLLVVVVNVDGQRDFCSGLRQQPPNNPVNDPIFLNYSYSRGITWGQLTKLCDALPKSTSDKVYYHWDTMKNCVRWGIQGYINEGEIAFFDSNNAGMKAGGGYYVASTGTSSSSYGVCATYINIPMGTPMMTLTNVINNYLSIPSNIDFTDDVNFPVKVRIGYYVPFLHDVYNDKDWYVTHSHLLLQNIWAGPAINKNDTVAQSAYGGVQWSKISGSDLITILLNDFSADYLNNLPRTPQGDTFRDGLGYLLSLMTLLEYQDGPSLYVNTIQNPTNPWSTFDPLHFEAFRVAKLKYYSKVLFNNEPCLTENGRFYLSSKNSAASYSSYVVDSLIQDILSSIGDGELPIRIGSVRAGGDEVNNSFFATGSQVEVMQKNPYLWVNAWPVPGKPDTYYAYYYYPDTFSHNLTKLRTLLPPARLPPNQNLTNTMLRDLLLGVVSQLYQQQVTVDNALDLVLKYVSVHPYDDFNGRTCRFLGWMATITDPDSFMQSFISDFDLVTPKPSYLKFVQASTAKYLALRKAMTNEFLRQALRLGQKAQDQSFYSLPEWFDLWNSLNVFGITVSPGQITQQHFQMIKSRQWIPLLDSLAGGTRWRIPPSSSFDWRNH